MMRGSFSVLAIVTLGLPTLASAGSLSSQELEQITAGSGLQGPVSVGHYVTTHHYAYSVVGDIDTNGLAGAMAHLPQGVVMLLDPSLNHHSVDGQAVNGANAADQRGVFAFDRTNQGPVGVAVRMNDNWRKSGASAHASTSGGQATVSARSQRIGGRQILSSSASSSASGGR